MFSKLRSALVIAVVGGLVFSSLAAGPGRAPIRLRNETITPSASAASVQSAVAVAVPESGLFLVQFSVPPTAAEHERLRAQGVDLLRYVPDNAFIARLDRVSTSALAAQSGVTFVGPYTPAHKLHRGLATAASATNASSLAVSVLLAPRAVPGELARVGRMFQRVQQRSELPDGGVVRGRLPLAQLSALAASDAVLWIEAARPMKLQDEIATKIIAGDTGSAGSLAAVHELGFTGAGVVVAVADSGLDSGEISDMHPDIAGRVDALFAYGGLLDAADEHGHGSHCAGIVAGNAKTGETDESGFWYGLGVAPGAHLIAQRMFDAAGGYFPPPSYGALTRDATRAGAVIASNSWGDDTQGRYDNSAYEFDALVRDADTLRLGDQPYILEFSAGNAGPGTQTIGSPAVGKNVIATGACNSDRRNLPIEEFTIYDTGPDTMADFSSRGPCEDGRIKPDVTAPGTWIASLRSVYANDDNAWMPISDSYMYQGGTSQAGPQVAGAAAVFVQYWRATHTNATPSPALVKAALINSAADMDDAVETAPVPNMDEGWGRVDLPALVASASHYEFLDQSVLLTNGQSYERRIVVSSFDTPLKITLTYSDVPGLPAAIPALVNDLDLEVVAPDGQVYRGNQFEAGESVADLPGADTINNVEGILLSNPLPGEYVVRVRASRVVQDARRDTAVIDQDFALVISATVAASGVGIHTMDRAVYRAPDVIKLSLVDYDLAGQGSAVLLLRSDTETNGEAIMLRASGSSGLFTGAVATVIGPALADSKLQVNHGDVIEAVYQDVHPVAIRIQRARADLRPPVISTVAATNEFGQILVSWATDEPASGVLFYGTNSLNFTATNRLFDPEQQIVLTDIVPNQVYHFAVSAVDEAGNRATNNNGGANFTFVALPSPGVFLVDAYSDLGGFLTVPPLSGYLDALDALGVACDVFDATAGAVPTLTQLRAHRCVIWRPADLESPSVTLVQRLRDYVNGGGSLMFASMECLTRLNEVNQSSFITNVLQVQSFTEDQTVEVVLGAPGDPVGAGIDATLDYAAYEEVLLWSPTGEASDWITPTANAAAFLKSGYATVGVRSPKPGRDLPGRVVCLSFPLDTVPLGSGIGNNRAGLLRNILNFLAPEPGHSTLTFDSDVYTLPSRVVVEVEDAALAGQLQATAILTSPRQTNGLTVTLLKTTRPGLFRGTFFIVATNTGAAATLAASSGDAISAAYLDVASGQTVTTTATIDTTPPAIDWVETESGYLEAVISWETTKPADSLIQYSESPDSFNGTNSLPTYFTAYDETMDNYHALLIQGLQPDRTYYFRVTSRDRAGNTATDDNAGQLYSLTTLLPLTAPWADDMETPGADWSTYAVTDSETDWTLGPPGGGETATSGTNCWGSNLSGGALSQAECYLISPGILLTGGNRATLRFQHNYDFTPKTETLDIEIGAVEIITDITAQPVPIQQFMDASGGWEEAEVDLTPYMGKVVYLVWYYALLSFDAVPRLGWLVDDVSVTVDYVAPGTIQITNNIAGAVFELRGPTSTNGLGRWLAITNAVPGEYVLEFGDAPGYLTPPSQTNTLVSGGLIKFSGNYTAPPVFRLLATRLGNGQVRLDWPTQPTLKYRVHDGAGLGVLTPFSDWQTNGSFAVPSPTNSAPRFFRVEAAPRN